MVINTSQAGDLLTANLQNSQALLSTSLERLSSGSNISSPAENPSGTAAAALMSSQAGRVNAAQANIGAAMSFTQSQDGYLQNIGTALNRMGQLSVLAQDVTKTDADRVDYNKEFQAIANYVSSTVAQDYNGVSLFSGNSVSVTTSADGSTMDMAGVNLNAPAYANAYTANISTTASAATALAAVQAAVSRLGADRADVGSYQSRLTYANDQLSVTAQNLSSGTSAITDTDIAGESTTYARANILVQSSTAMLAQANLDPQIVLSLLR